MPDTKVNTDADANGSVVEAIVSINGGHVVIWDDAGDIVSQRYDSSGAPVGGVTTVNTVTDGRQSGVVASGLPNAGYVVVWASPAAEGGGNELRGRV